MAALNPMAPAGAGPIAPGAPAPNVGASQKSTPFWGGDGFTFGDLVDLVNPLQHIPVVSWAYRAITGDQIAPGAMAIGGALFGGLAGFSLGTAEAMIKSSSGKDTGGHLFALLRQAVLPGDAPGSPVVADAAPQDRGPAFSPDRTPVLTLEQMAVLLASLPAPATNQNLAAPLAWRRSPILARSEGWAGWPPPAT
jgi:hypothetical protein